MGGNGIWREYKKDKDLSGLMDETMMINSDT
jgi:hypothetical protein